MRGGGDGEFGWCGDAQNYRGVLGCFLERTNWRKEWGDLTCRVGATAVACFGYS